MIRRKYKEPEFASELRTIAPLTIKFKRHNLPDGLLDISNYHCGMVSMINSNVYILFIIYLCTKPINSSVDYNVHIIERLINKFFTASWVKYNVK